MIILTASAGQEVKSMRGIWPLAGWRLGLCLQGENLALRGGSRSRKDRTKGGKWGACTCRRAVFTGGDKTQGMAVWAGRGLGPRAVGASGVPCEFQSPSVKTGSDGDTVLWARGNVSLGVWGTPRTECRQYRLMIHAWG